MNVNIQGNLKALAKGALRQWAKTVAAAGTPERITRRAISGITITAGGICTATTAVAHDLEVDDEVNISGATPASYNTNHTVLTVPSATTFTFQMPPGTAAPTGTIVLDADIYFRKAVFVGVSAARVANVDSVYYGAKSTNDSQPHEVTPTNQAIFEAAAGVRLNLKDLYLDVINAADGVVITLH